MLIDVLLTNEKVRMRDSSVVEHKLNEIINSERDKLLVKLLFGIILRIYYNVILV